MALNGHAIYTAVAPKKFHTLDKFMFGTFNIHFEKDIRIVRELQ